MTHEMHFRKLENMYRIAPINRYFQPSVTIGHGTAEITIPIREEFFHAAGATHGLVYFKVLDDATFFAANSLVEDVFVLTASFNLYFLRPIIDGEIRGVAHVVNASKRRLIADGVAYDGNGQEVARGSGVFMKSDVPLTPEIGYELSNFDT